MVATRLARRTSISEPVGRPNFRSRRPTEGDRERFANGARSCVTGEDRDAEKGLCLRRLLHGLSGSSLSLVSMSPSTPAGRTGPRAGSGGPTSESSSPYSVSSRAAAEPHPPFGALALVLEAACDCSAIKDSSSLSTGGLRLSGGDSGSSCPTGFCIVDERTTSVVAEASVSVGSTAWQVLPLSKRLSSRAWSASGDGGRMSSVQARDSRRFEDAFENRSCELPMADCEHALVSCGGAKPGVDAIVAQLISIVHKNPGQTCQGVE